MNEHVGVTLDILPGTLGGLTAALGGFNELVAATSMLTTAIGRSTSAVDSMMLTLGVGLVGLGYESAKAFGEVERSMKIVQSVSGQTSSEIGVLTQQANELSVRYKMGIDEITDGLTTLGRAGLSSVNTQLDTMKAGLEAAKVTGLQLDDVLNKIVQTTALLGGDINSSAFGYQSQELTSKILATSQTAPIDMNDVVQTLSYSGGTAAAGGINIQNEDALYDYLGTIAAFGQKGVSGSMAGTALRAFFTKPASQTSQVNEALGRLNMKPEDLWEDGGNKIRPVSEQIELIQKQMDKLKISQIDQIELWGKIVSPKMGQQMLKLNADSIRDLTEKIKQTDSAEALAQNTMNNFLSDLHTLSEQGQRTWREYGQAALTWISPVVKGISGLMNLLGADVNGFPIFQQIGKGLIIIVISQVIQRLGSVWNLIKGIGGEVKSQLAGFSQVKRTQEQIERDLMREYETMGLTERQAKTLVSDSQKMNNNFGTSNKVLAEFLAKLNEAVNLMTKLASLSQINSMRPIGNMTGAQYDRFYNKSKVTTAWYNTEAGINTGHLTKTEFAKLSLRHGIDQDKLRELYYGRGTSGSEFHKYALANQFKGNAADMKKGFITATTLEKYLQENKKGMYDPKNNPMIGLVQQVKGDTDKIATAVSVSGHDSSSSTKTQPTSTAKAQQAVEEQKGVELEQQKNQLKEQGISAERVNNEITRLEENIKRNNLDLEIAKEYLMHNGLNAEDENVRETRQRAQWLYEQIQMDEALLNIERSKLQYTSLEESIMSRKAKIKTLQAQWDENLLKSIQAIANGHELQYKRLGREAALIEERLMHEEAILFSLQQTQIELGKISEAERLETAEVYARISQEGMYNQLTLAALEEKRTAIQTQVAELRAQIGNYGSQIGFATQIAALENTIKGLLAEDAALQAEITELDIAIRNAKEQELVASRSKAANTASSSPNYVYGKGRRGRAGKFFETRIYDREFGPFPKGDMRNLTNNPRVIYPNVNGDTKSHFNFIKNNVSSIKNSISSVTTPLKSGLSRIMSPITSRLPGMPNTGFVSTASSAMSASMMGGRNYKEGRGFLNNWFWNAGMMQMVNRDAITKTTANMGRLGKVSGVAAGALGSLGMMFGPIEIGMLAISAIMQGLQTAYQNYQKELEEINSELSEAREKIKEAEESFLSAYEEQNPKATQDEKDEALLKAYSGDTSASKDDGLQTYRNKLFGAVSAIEVNTRQKAEKEQHSIWGESGDWEKQMGGKLKAMGGWQIVIPGIGQMGARDVRYSGDYYKELREQLDTKQKAAETLGNDKEFGILGRYSNFRLSDDNIGYMLDKKQVNSAESITDQMTAGLDLSTERLDMTLNHYPEWINELEDKSDNAKYARSIMAEGIDYMGPTKDNTYEGIWGEGSAGQNLAQYYKMQSEAMQMSSTEKTMLMNAINDESDFFKKMQKMYFKDSKNGKLVGRDSGTEVKILKAIQHRLGGISQKQAQIALTLATVSEIQKVVSEQVQPTLMSHMEAAWQGVSISGETSDQVGGTWGTTAAVQQGVSIISAQMARLLQQKAMELGSLQAEMAGIDMKDLDKLRQADQGHSAEINGHQYSARDVSNAKKIFEAMETSPYEAIALQRGETPKEAHEWAETMKDKLNENNADALAVWTTQAKGLQYYLDPIVTQAYIDSLKDSDAKATGPADTDDKKKSKDKDSSKDANRKNWVNLAICNKKEIPKLNVNLFKKPPNFTILNRNFKLRDVNVNTADDAKSIQNAVKNSIIEIQNRSNPKIIQDDSAEYDPVNATDGNTLPTGTKKTE